MSITAMEIKQEFEDLFKFKSEKEEIDHEARMIMFRFLSEVEKIVGNDKGYKKRLSRALGVSQSYITQLFTGEKLVNLTMLAKMQKELGIKFEVSVTPH